MKQCTTCRTTYTDDTLKYCLADGGTLIGIDDEQETVVRPGVRVDIEPERKDFTAPTVARKGNPTLKILIAVLLAGFLGLIVLGAAGVFLYMNTGTNSNTAVKSPTPVPTSPTTDSEKEKLERELANLQKKLDEQKKAETNKTPPTFESDDLPTARVNSPGDGFLALRDEPDAEKGERLARIPHGTVVVLENCEKQKTTIDGRSGRWCMVTHAGQSGWVFDAWLDY